MISLHNYRILKNDLNGNEILDTGVEEIFGVFELEEEKARKSDGTEEKKTASEPSPQEAILEEMIWKAEALVETAKKEAEIIKSQAYEEGYKEGQEEGRTAGRKEAYNEGQQKIKEEVHKLEEKIGQYVADMEIEKEKLLEKYLDDLKNISLAIGEKIVQTSLKSSNDVIKRMIIAATEKLKKTAWARVYIAKTQEEMEIQGDRELLKELAKLSDNVKIIIMEDTEPGTCIIELPQEIIDISTGTQMENIRDILNNARL